MIGPGQPDPIRPVRSNPTRKLCIFFCLLFQRLWVQSHSREGKTLLLWQMLSFLLCFFVFFFSRNLPPMILFLLTCSEGKRGTPPPPLPISLAVAVVRMSRGGTSFNKQKQLTATSTATATSCYQCLGARGGPTAAFCFRGVPKLAPR